MNENQLKFLWDNYANNKGFNGYDEFKSLMANNNSRKVFFENSNKELGFKDYNEFESILGVKKKDGTQAASGQPVQQPGQPSAPSFGQKVVTDALVSGQPVMKGVKKEPQKKEQDITFRRPELPSETTQAQVPQMAKTIKSVEEKVQEGKFVQSPVTKISEEKGTDWTSEETIKKVNQKAFEKSQQVLQEKGVNLLSKEDVDNQIKKEYEAQFGEEIDSYMESAGNKSDKFFPYFTVAPADLTDLQIALGQREVPNGTTIEKEGKRGEITSALMDDYFTYMKAKYPEVGEAEQNKYLALKSKADRSAKNEEWLHSMETRAIQMKMSAVKRNYEKQKSAVNEYSQIEASIDTRMFDSGVIALNKERAAIDSEYKRLNEQASQSSAQWSEKEAAFNKAIESLNAKASSMNREDYEAEFNKITDEYKAEYEAYKTKYPSFAQLEERSNKLQQDYETLKVRSRMTDENVAKLQQAKGAYQQLGQSALSLKALGTMNQENINYYSEYSTLKDQIEKAQEAGKQRWESASPLMKMVYAPGELANTFASGIGDLALNVVQIPKVVEDLITGNTEYNFLDEFYDGVENYRMEKQLDFPSIDSESTIQYLAGLGGNTLSSLAVFALGGTFGGASKMSQFGATFVSSMLTTEVGAYEEAINTHKMSPRQAAAASTAVSVATSLVEGLIPDIKYFEPSAFRKSMLNEIASGKSVSQAFRNAMPESAESYLLSGLKEGGEELAQQTVDDGVKGLINYIGETEYFKDLLNSRAYKDAALGGLIGGSVGNFFKRPVGASNISEEVMLEAVENADGIIAAYNNNNNIGKLKQDMKGPREDFMNLSAHPNWKNLDRPKKARAFGITQQIRTLEDTDLKDPIINAQIERLKNERQEILSLGENGISAKSVGTSTTPQRVVIGGQYANFFINEDGDYEIEYNNGKSVIVEKGEGAVDKIREMGIETDEGVVGEMNIENQNTLITPTLEKGATINYAGKNATLNNYAEKNGKIVSVNITTEDGKTLQIREGQQGNSKLLLENLNNLKYDKENETRVSGQVGVGQEPVAAKPIEVPSAETPEAGGVLQAQREEIDPRKVAVEKAQNQLDGVNSRINPKANHPLFNVGQKHDPGNKLIVTNSEDRRTDTTKDGVEVITKVISPAEVDENGIMTKTAQVEIGTFDSYEQAQEYVNSQYNKYKAIADEKLAKAKAELAALEAPKTQEEVTPTTEAAPQSQQEVIPPTDDQIFDDIKNKRFATFTYNSEAEVPENLKNKISSKGEINGKPFVRVTLAKSSADYELAKAAQVEDKAAPQVEEAAPAKKEKAPETKPEVKTEPVFNDDIKTNFKPSENLLFNQGGSDNLQSQIGVDPDIKTKYVQSKGVSTAAGRRKTLSNNLTDALRKIGRVFEGEKIDLRGMSEQAIIDYANTLDEIATKNERFGGKRATITKSSNFGRDVEEFDGRVIGYGSFGVRIITDGGAIIEGKKFSDYTPKIEEEPVAEVKEAPKGKPGRRERLAKLFEEPKVEVAPTEEAGVEATPEMTPEEIRINMKPITDEMAGIEMQFSNSGYSIDWDYDNEIIITDKNGEIVDAEELPKKLLPLAAQYEKATAGLAGYDFESYQKALEQSRKDVGGIETEFEEVKPLAITEKATQKEKKAEPKKKRDRIEYVANKLRGKVKGLVGNAKGTLSRNEVNIFEREIESLEKKAIQEGNFSFDEKRGNPNYEKIDGKEQKVNTYEADGYTIKYESNPNSSFVEVITPSGETIRLIDPKYRNQSNQEVVFFPGAQTTEEVEPLAITEKAPETKPTRSQKIATLFGDEDVPQARKTKAAPAASQVPDKKGIPSKFTKDNIGELVGATVVVYPSSGPMKVIEVRGPFDPYEGYATFNTKKGLTEEYHLIDEDGRGVDVFINDKGELESSIEESVFTNDPNAKYILKEATEETPLSINKFKKGDVVKYIKDGQQYEVLNVDPTALSSIKNIETGKVISVAYPANFLPSSREELVSKEAEVTPKEAIAEKATKEAVTEAAPVKEELTENEQVNALITKKNRYNKIPKTRKPLAGKLLDEIKAEAEQLGFTAINVENNNISIRNKKDGKVVARRDVDRKFNKAENDKLKEAKSMAGDFMFGLQGSILLYFIRGGKINAKSAELGEGTEELQSAKNRGIVSDTGPAADKIVERLTELGAVIFDEQEAIGKIQDVVASYENITQMEDDLIEMLDKFNNDMDEAAKYEYESQMRAAIRNNDLGSLSEDELVEYYESLSEDEKVKTIEDYEKFYQEVEREQPEQGRQGGYGISPFEGTTQEAQEQEVSYEGQNIREAVGYRGLPGEYIQDYNGVQYFAENEKYAGVFGKNIIKANISKNKVLDLAKWNKKLKDAGIPDNGMGQPFLTIDQSMFDENRNFTTKGREGTFGKMKRAIGLDEFNKFKEEFDSSDVIYGEDAGNAGEMVYAVRNPKAIKVQEKEIGYGSPLSSVEETAKALDGLDVEPLFEKTKSTKYFRGQPVEELPKKDIFISPNEIIGKMYTKGTGVLKKLSLKTSNLFDIDTVVTKDLNDRLIDAWRKLPSTKALTIPKEVVNGTYIGSTYAQELKEDEQFRRALEGMGYDGLLNNFTRLKLTSQKQEIIVFDQSNLSEINANLISELYHKAKADGSNPEIVKAVEDLIGNKKITDGPNKGLTQTDTAAGPFVSESGNTPYSKRGGVRGQAVREGGVGNTVKAVWNKYKQIKFNGSIKVKDAEDVAHIMRKLEDKSVEHAFAIHVDKNGKTHIQFLGMGGPTATVVDPRLVLAGAKKFKSKKVYLVHNHPSGSLAVSSQDMQLTKTVAKVLEPLDIDVEHVIMDTYRKEYVHIDSDETSLVKKRDLSKESLEEYNKALKVQLMDEQKILSEPVVSIQNSADVADFLMQLRFTALPKHGMLLLNQNKQVIGNYIFKKAYDYNETTSFIAQAGIGTLVIFYTNQGDYNLLLKTTRPLEAAGIKVLDYVVVNSESEGVKGYYQSFADSNRLLETQAEYGTNSIPNELREPAPRSNAEIQQLMEDSMDAVDSAIESGGDAQSAVNDLIGNKDWYFGLTAKQKTQFDEILQDEFGVIPTIEQKIAPKAAPKAAPTSGLAANISSIVENYYKIKDGDRAERAAARDAIDEILNLDPKLKYIYKNISDINKQLQEAGVITDKTDGCP